ncbi:MAG: glycosyltransferase [bacterium]|nr:glycosyltransferase [bacterium]
MVYPTINMEHVRTLTDDTGIFQHAKYSVPHRNHGYCTDDNSRALLAAARHHEITGDQSSMDMLTVYISYLHHAQTSDGRFHNFMSFSREFLDDYGSEDCFGRAIWSLGYVLSSDLPDRVRLLAWHVFDKARPRLRELTSLRGNAYTLLGLSHFAESEWADINVIRELERGIDVLTGEYARTRTHEWRWFENIMAYSNGLLPYCLLASGTVIDDGRALKTAYESLDFLSETTIPGDMLEMVGCNGWYPRGGGKAVFDHQPVDAMMSVLAYCEAYDLTGDAAYKRQAEISFQWFTGNNILSATMYDPRTGGCYDGLTSEGPNLNQGAESTVAFVIAQLRMLEMLGDEYGEYPITKSPVAKD